jgi:hypothetical protein
LLRALAGDSEALDASQARGAAVGRCVANGWLDYDGELDVVRTTWDGRASAGLPCCVSPAFTGDNPAGLTDEERAGLMRRTAWFGRSRKRGKSSPS